MDGYNTIFEYIAETTHSDQKVARVLGCWHQPTQMIEPAKLDSYGPKALPQQAFARRLFAHYTSRLQKESFEFALAAVLLVYYTDTMAKCPQHKVLDAMAAACTTVCGHNSPSDAEKTLREWGDGVRERFVRENVARLPSSNEEETLRNNFASTL
ncbi:unnamed protein product, partial [Aphanomyces euteiches]